ncbi:MFS transporter [Nonomuraea sp. GTA35]|uniref:MFS transporter n=1 Tax=Nonomuraea sp. GTA35 TaxID=1676746 RepID=UPI0035C0ED4E
MEEMRAGRRQWWGLAVLALPTLLLSINNSVLHLALPALSADLAPSGPQQLWIMDVYGFLMAGLLVPMAALGDRLGRRRILLWGAAAFGAASVLAAWSGTPELLIAARALMGVAGATLMPSTLALLRTMFPVPAQRTVAMPVWVSCFMSGSVVGPVVGGLLLEVSWWGSVFLLNVPLMMVLLGAGPFLLPEQRVPGARRPDLGSAALALTAVLVIVYGAKNTAAGDAAGVLAIAVGLGLGAVFVRRQRRMTAPMLDLELLGERAFVTALATMALTVFTVAGTTFLIYQYLQGVLGLSPLRAGLWLLPAALAGIAMSTFTPAWLRRLRPARVLGTGLLLAAAGCAIMIGADGPSGAFVLGAGTVLLRVGLTPVIVISSDTIVGAAPPERAGAASALQETAGELGMALGVAILGSLGTYLYRDGVYPAIPYDAPAALTDTVLGGIAGAATLAAHLPGPDGERLLHVAREAWTHALHINAALSAALFLGIAAFHALRSRPSTARDQDF